MGDHETFNKIITPVLAFAMKECKPYNAHFHIRNFIRQRHGNDTELPVGSERIDPPTVATAVHYLTRWVLSAVPARQVFELAYNAAVLVGQEEEAKSCIRDLDAAPQRLKARTVEAAVKLSVYEAVCRQGVSYFNRLAYPAPYEYELKHIADLVNRAKKFFLSQGIIKTQITFDGVNTRHHLKGAVSYLSDDTLWEMKVSKNLHPTSADKIALIVYLIMLRREGRDITNSITKIGLYQANINQSCVFDINTLDPDVYDDIERLIYG